jgi:Cu(I)/Ag(I) efflux system periplasmic protein CusF
MHKAIVTVAAIVGGIFSAVSLAQPVTSTDHASHHVAQGTAAQAPMTDGEVRKVDKSAGKLTLKHGPIPNLDMPDMTMVFRVKESAMLDQVKVGDKVRFAADKVGGQYTVVKIEPVK